MRILAIGDPFWGDCGHLSLYHSAHGHEVRTAGPGGAVDHVFGADETATEFLARLAPEWQPDVVYCSFPEMYPPPLEIEHCPVTTVAAISDWNLYGPQLEYNLSRFDAVLSDLPATRRLKLFGAQTQFLFPLYSHRTHIHRWLDRPRETDVLFLGNLNHAIHRERGQVLEQVAKRSEGLRVVIDAGLPPEEYALRLNEAKIALNFGVRGEMNLRSFEAPACGALLFVEEDNAEVFDWLEPWVHCIPYSLENVEARIRQWLADAEARERVAEAGRQRVLQLAAERRLDALFHWMGAVPRGERAFTTLDPRQRALQDALLYGTSADAGQQAHSRAILQRLRAAHPEDGEVLTACGCSAYDHAKALGNAPSQRDARRAFVRESIEAFDAASRALSNEAVPLMNLATLARQAGAAAERTYLERAIAAEQANFGGYLLGRVSDPFYAAWRLAMGLGEAQPTLLRAAAHTRLAELLLAARAPGEARAHAEAAMELAPEIATAYTLGGRAAQQAGDLAGAEALLRAGLRLTSFDVAHRQALLEVLRAREDVAAAEALAHESARIFGVCPPLSAYVPIFASGH